MEQESIRDYNEWVLETRGVQSRRSLASLSLCVSLSRTLSLSFSFSPSHPLSLSLSLSISLSRYISLSLSLSLYLSLSTSFYKVTFSLFARRLSDSSSTGVLRLLETATP